MYKSAVLRAPSAKGRKSKGHITPPHSMSGGAVDENRRRKRLYPKELRQPHPLLKCVSSGAVDTGPITPPLTHWPTGQRMDHVDANAYFRGSFEHLSVGQPGWPTVHRLARTGEPARRRRLAHNAETPLPPIGGPKRQKPAYFSGILTPSAISRVWRRGVCRALYAIQVVFFGLPPPPSPSPRWGREGRGAEGGQDANSIWRHL
jgi:hypothetical protein